MLAAGAALVVLAAVVFALHRWVATDDFRLRMESQAGAALGVPVRMGAIEVAMWPLPAVALAQVTVQSPTPVTLERIEVRPLWQPLLRGRLQVATLVVRKAVLPQRGIDAILLALQKKESPPATSSRAGLQLASAGVPASADATADDLSWLPRRTLLDDVTWVSTTGSQTALDGDIRLGPDGLPDSAALQLIRGHHAGLKARLEREARDASGEAAAPAIAGDQWQLRVDVGGGTMQGKLGMQRVPVALSGPAARASGKSRGGYELVLQGQLETRQVEITALTAPDRPLGGKLDAATSLSARAATTAGLVDALQTRTSFTVRDAVLHGIDLVKAVSTVGLSKGGQTRLETLAGQVSTDGRAARLTNLVATSGVLSASGNVAVSPAKALSGRVSVQVATGGKLGAAIGGAVGVPLEVGGSLDDPQVTLSRSAMLGAALGTVLLPGAGTGAGANLGDRLGDKLKGLFGR